MAEPDGKTPTNRDINSWAELTSLASEHSNGKWVFRGVANVDHELIPKIGRAQWRRNLNATLAELLSDTATRNFDLTEEKWLLLEFRNQARPYLTYYHPRSDIEWLAIAQHHGLPTRLLDWSESILTAAYFAVEAAGIEGDAAIFAYEPSHTMHEDEDPFSLSVPKLYRPPHISPRIPAQRAVFSVSCDPTKRLVGPGNIRKYQIPQLRCFEIKRVLDACAINRATLFPDLDGLCGALGWRYKWGALP